MNNYEIFKPGLIGRRLLVHKFSDPAVCAEEYGDISLAPLSRNVSADFDPDYLHKPHAPRIASSEAIRVLGSLAKDPVAVSFLMDARTK